MSHFTTPDFWKNYNALPEEVRELADKNYSLLRAVMSREEFDAALAEATQRYPPGVHQGWKADLENLYLSGVVTGRARMIGAPLVLLEVQCRAETPGLSGIGIAEGLERFWLVEMIFRAEPECHFLSITGNSVVLDAFTIHKNHYVSVRATVDMGEATAA